MLQLFAIFGLTATLGPKFHYFDHANSNFELIIIFLIIVFLIPILGNIYIIRWVVNPLKKLIHASEDLAPGHWQSFPSENIPIAEIRQLFLAFNQTALQLQQLQQSFIQVQRELQGSRELHQKVVQSQTDFILRSQPDTTITFANKSLCQALGLTLEEVVGLKWLNFISREDLEITLEKIANLTPEQPNFVNENQDRRSGGTIGYTQWINQGIFDNQGNLTEIQSVGRDISTLKQTQEELSKSKRFIESIAEATPSLLYIYDHIDQANVYANRSVGEILGYSKEEIQGMGSALLFNICHPDDFPRVLDAVQKCQTLKDGEIIEIEYRVIDSQGHYHWLLSRDLVFARTETGEVWQTLGTAQDITARKNAEIEIREIRNFLASIIENIPDMVFVKDANTLKFIELNKAGELLIGYTREEVLGKNDYDLFSPEQAESLIHQDKQILIEGKIKDIPMEIIQTPHRGYRILHTKIIPIFDEDDKPKHLLGISEDITDLVKLEQRLTELARHLPGVIYQFRMRSDGTFHFPYASEGIRDIYGVSPEDVKEDASPVFNVLHPDEVEKISQSIYESAEKLTPWQYEYRVCFADGRVIWVLGYATPKRENDGSTIWHGYIKDVTERKEKEYLLIKAKERAENAEQTLQKAQIRLERFNKKLSQLVDIDGLTKIANRRCFNIRIKQEWRRLSRAKGFISLILFDIDFFKNYNDYYGHPEGDTCLIKVAQAARKVLSRPADLVARFGGEEFVVILPETGSDGAILVAQKISTAIEQLAIAHGGSYLSGQKITVSLGISTEYLPSQTSPRALIERADQALYEAKRRGRNQCVVWTEQLGLVSDSE